MQKKLTVPANHVFVLADNPSTSRDSLTFGPVPTREIDYKVIRQLLSRR